MPMNAKPTPGPWRAELQIVNYRSGRKDLVVNALRADGIPQSIATITGIDDGKANARLIAAAPDLYEALDALTERVEMCNRGVAEYIELVGLAQAARATLAKAQS